MKQHLSPSRDPGLLSVLENGLAVIKDKKIDGARRQQILDVLNEMFSEASRGSKALSTHNLLDAAEEPALERLSLFVNYLDDPFGADLPNRLSEAAAVVTELRKGHPQDNTSTERVCDIIEKLLAALKTDYLTTPLASPVEFQY